MIWQDIVFALGSLVFIAALVGMVRAAVPPPFYSSLSTALVLATFSVCYATLGLYFADATTAVSSALWLTLALRRRLHA